eukprot:9160731-Karenia_brevis.AAC.1
MLASLLEVVSPKLIKDKDLIPGIHFWVREVADLKSRFGEEIKGNVKLTTFLSMLPEDYQGEILKMGSSNDQLEYEKVKGYVLSLVQQMASNIMPKQSDILNVPVEGQEEEEAPHEY